MSQPSWFSAKWFSLVHFYRDVVQEMKRVTWPTRSEVTSTTLVVIIAVIFFSAFLWIVDKILTLGFEQIAKIFR